MGRHNGKSRNVGLRVGKALTKKLEKAKEKTRPSQHSAREGNRSILERNDLEEIVAVAELAGREFDAVRSKVVVLGRQEARASAGPVDDARRAAALVRGASLMRIPRRPPWRSSMSTEALEEAERRAFLEWRRSLARFEEDEPGVVLTPFEKNLEVWRQLWRVLERSDILVQVVDARDPLFYHSADLEAYARDLHPNTSCILLLNKSDLLSAQQRQEWAEYFTAHNMKHIFWSAHLAEASLGDGDVDGEEEGGAAESTEEGKNPNVKVLNASELMARLEAEALEATQAGSHEGSRDGEQPGRLVVGLTGYPNVGKSSTINALYGKKKTAVAATPGRTKHFQTLIVSDSLCLCDCPGLVLPQIASSKADMVAAGILPIDHLVDVRAPIQAITNKLGLEAIERFYGVQIPREGPEGSLHPLSQAARVLAAVALSRGWTQGGGLPDETRTGRHICKDYFNGKIAHCERPPRSTDGSAGSKDVAGVPNDRPAVVNEADRSASGDEEVSCSDSDDILDAFEAARLGPGDLELAEEVGGSTGSSSQPRRPDYKFHKKAAKKKGSRGRKWNDENPAGSVGVFIAGRR